MSSDEKVSVNRTCKFCDVICSRKNDWDRHVLTAKHQKNIKLDDSANSNKAEFYCEKCDYSCSKLSLWEKHIDTMKHKLPKIPQKYECTKCKKVYDRYNSYWAHSKKCTKNAHDISPIEQENTSQYKDLINRLMIDNQELRNFIVDQSKLSSDNMNKIIEQNTDVVAKAIECLKNTSSNTTINGNVNNTQKFNINIFLNEQCKDAINFADFMKNIEISHQDLENNAQLGFVAGISKIFLDNLKQLGVNERPIHCTDAKRETMYIKDEDKWTKETDDAKLQKAIQTVSYRSIGKLAEWKQENPEYQDVNSKFSNQCLEMHRQTLAGSDRDVYYPKVIHALAKEVMIDK